MALTYRLAVVSALSTALLISSCHHVSRYKITPPDVNSMEDIGSVRVSIQSVAPWVEYKDALKLNYKLTEDKALELIASDTRFLAEQTLDSVKAVIKLAKLPSTQTTVTETSTEAGENSVTETETITPGGLSTVPYPTITANSGSGDNIPSVGAAPASELVRADARVRYQLATALYQEVQLLNRYVEDVATREGYVPYVIRLQVTSMPRSRHLPYDAYVNLGFFNNREQRLVNSEYTDKRLPIVLPIFATDSLENSLTSAELGSLRELGLSLSTLGSNAFGGEFGSISQDIEAALGRDSNSLFTIGRLSDNVIRIRIGAMQQVRTDYALIPKTETVTVLVMVDKDISKENDPKHRTLHIHSYSEFIHATGGAVIKPTPDDRSAQREGEIIKLHRLDRLFKSDEDVRDMYYILWNHVVLSEWNKFTKMLDKWCANAKLKQLDVTHICNNEDHFLETEQLWTDISYFQQLYSEDTLRVEIPQEIGLKIFGAQTALLMDDEKRFSKIMLRGGLRLEAEKLCAALFFFNDATKAKVIDIIPTLNTSIGDRGSSVTFEFPSMKTSSLSKEIKEDKAQLRVAVRTDKTKSCFDLIPEQAGCPSTNTCSKSVRYIKAFEPQKQEVHYTITAVTGFVVTDTSGTGKLHLVVATSKESPTPDKITLSLLNANLEQVIADGTDITKTGNSFDLIFTGANQKKTVTLKMNGLAVGEDIKITSKDNTNAEADPIILKVRMNSNPKSDSTAKK